MKKLFLFLTFLFLSCPSYAQTPTYSGVQVTNPGYSGSQAQTDTGWTKSGTIVRITTATNNVGIGTSLSANKLDVSSNVAIGTAYAGYSSAPANGLIVQGNVGIASVAPGSILDVQGASRIFGNVGIGTTNAASYDLWVYGQGSMALQNNDNTLASTVRFINSAGTLSGFLSYRDSGASTPNVFRVWAFGSGTPLSLGAGGDHIYIPTSGNVGIGTTNPGVALDIGSSGNVRVQGLGGSSADILCRKADKTIGVCAGTIVGDSCTTCN